MIKAMTSTVLQESIDEMPVSPPTPPEEHPGWMKRLGRRVHVFMRVFRMAVDRRPWLALAYKITIALLGGIVILAGIAMLVLPGPGWLTIFLGFAILGSEFHWARKILTWLRMKVHIYADRYRRWRARRKASK